MAPLLLNATCPSHVLSVCPSVTLMSHAAGNTVAQCFFCKTILSGTHILMTSSGGDQCKNRHALEMGRMGEAEGLGKLTERVPNVRPNFGRMLCARMKQRLLLVSALSGQKMS